ncbi:hypothetical protein KL86SPO_31192 [uncultured Sporomusa sp.]|uniref:Uncharacterized protein n=1 Tax=uncultured Sporomusa sp. TaxID=307249 RepID=A0A212LU06_9FIRM|nr:hypothetical protein KL86SPO_31192 [uncultured Sporomusa sp.]
MTYLRECIGFVFIYHLNMEIMILTNLAMILVAHGIGLVKVTGQTIQKETGISN